MIGVAYLPDGLARLFFLLFENPVIQRDRLQRPRGYQSRNTILLELGHKVNALPYIPLVEIASLVVALEQVVDGERGVHLLHLFLQIL